MDANPCKKCNCNNHADECIYDRTLDTDPTDRTKPGGGVCLGCKDNTIGRYCQACKPFYYRPSGKLLDDADVCQPCDCISPGVMKGVYECEGVS